MASADSEFLSATNALAAEQAKLDAGQPNDCRRAYTRF
jgi:hypothetical protein